MPERRLTGRQKRAIGERAGWRCEYCRCPASYSSRRALRLAGAHPPPETMEEG